ncbi:swi5-like zinc finger protein [Coemansia sp. Benny D160-2]|nr:swi5-like zinc finger protein [Coemansia sp. Benny D160-2]
MDSSPTKRSSKTEPSANGIAQVGELVATSPTSNEDPGDLSGALSTKKTLENAKDKELEETIASLKQELEALDQKKSELLLESSLSLDEARRMNEEHIDLLHRYNDIKDAGQILFGKLAELKGKTVKEVYMDYGVSLED